MVKMKSYVAVAKETYSKIAEQYDENGKYYADFYSQCLVPFEKLLKENFKNPKILDIGCGPGLELKILKKHGFRSFSGMDVSPEMLRVARRNFPGNKFYEGDITSKRLNKKFDAITMFSVIHLFKRSDVTKVLKNTRAMLKPNGYLLLMAFDRKKPRKTGFMKKTGYGRGDFKRYIREYTVEESKRMLANGGFDVVDSYTVRYRPPPGWKKQKGLVWVGLISKIPK